MTRITPEHPHDLPTLEQAVREAKDYAYVAGISADLAGKYLDALITASEALGAAKERQRIREAVATAAGVVVAAKSGGAVDVSDQDEYPTWLLRRADALAAIDGATL